MDQAVGPQCIGLQRAVAAALAVDEDDDMLAQVALVVEHIAAQAWIDGKGRVQRASRRQAAPVSTSGVSVKRRNCVVKTMRGMPG